MGMLWFGWRQMEDAALGPCERCGETIAHGATWYYRGSRQMGAYGRLRPHARRRCERCHGIWVFERLWATELYSVSNDAES